MQDGRAGPGADDGIERRVGAADALKRVFHQRADLVLGQARFDRTAGRQMRINAAIDRAAY